MVGDYVFTIVDGWSPIVAIYPTLVYPIIVGTSSYTLDGMFHVDDKYPSAFAEPPEGFNATPKPCKFVKGQKVLVRDERVQEEERAYFSHSICDVFYTFEDGKDEWASKGQVVWWNHYRAWEAQDEE